MSELTGNNLPIPNSPASMITVRIGNREYPLKSEPKCKTCQSGYRKYIESELLLGRGYRAIARSLPEDANISPDNIEDHFKRGHLPLPQAVQRRLIERRAAEIGIGIESEVETWVDKVTTAEMILHKGAEKIMSGEIEPDVKDTLQAIRLLHEIEKTSETSIDNDTWVSVVTVFMEEARRLMTAEQWQAFGRVVNSHPILKAISNKQESIEDAEIVGD